MERPLISIVITTKNEEKNIVNCLESIRRQTYSKDLLEVIVVDNNSSDKTKEIAGKYTKNVFNKGPERSAQRNFGVEKSKGKYVIYLDADMILSSTLIKKAVEKLESGDFDAFHIPEIILGNSYWNRVRRFERSFYDGTVIDCVRFVKKEIFNKVGGFDLQMTGPEDWDFDKKIRKIGRVEVLDKYDFEEISRKVAEIDYGKSGNLVEKLGELSAKALIYHNEAEFDLKKYFLKKGYYAKSFASYINKWGKDDPDIKKQFSFSYRYFNVFLENKKWKKFFLHPISVFGVFFLRFLVGVSYLVSLF